MNIFHSKQPPRIAFIRGYYGYSNIGDEAMLHVLIRSLIRNKITPLIASKDTNYTERIHNVDAVYAGAKWNFLKGFLSSNILIEGPGNKHGFISIIDLGLPILAKILRKNVWYVGVGLNPHVWKDRPTINRVQVMRYSVIKRFIISVIFNELVDRIYVRDGHSKQFLIFNGVRDRKIEVIKDLAYFLEPPSKERIIDLLSYLGIDCEKDKLVGISLRRFDDKKINECFSEKIKEIIIRIYGRVPQVKFIFLPFSTRGYDNDVEYSVTIKEMVKSVVPPNRLVIVDSDDPKVIKGIVSICSFIIGVRYHCCVFSSSCNVPFIAIMYDPKAEDVASKALIKVNINEVPVGGVVGKVVSELRVSGVEPAYARQKK